MILLSLIKKLWDMVTEDLGSGTTSPSVPNRQSSRIGHYLRRSEKYVRVCGYDSDYVWRDRISSVKNITIKYNSNKKDKEKEVK